MTTEENISDTMNDNNGVNDAFVLSHDGAGIPLSLKEEENEVAVSTNIELVSDEEEECPEEEPGVVTYSCTLGHNVPCVMQALAEGEDDTEAQASPAPGNVSSVKEAESDKISEPEDLITSNKCDGDDDFVAAPLTSKFVVNFTKADPEDQDMADTKPRTEPESDEQKLRSEDREEEVEPTEEAKEENQQTEIKQKVSTKEKIFNMLFGCFKSRKYNKSSS